MTPTHQAAAGGGSSSPSGIKDKAANTPAVIAWLLSNYDMREGAPSLPKAQVYQEYVNYCGDAGLEPTTPPAFGKILRLAFPSIECRRKGPRGEAKHHYKHFCKKSDLALLSLPPSSNSTTFSAIASSNGRISPSSIAATSKFDVSSGSVHRSTPSPAPSLGSASTRLSSLRAGSPFQPIMDDAHGGHAFPPRYGEHHQYHDGEMFTDDASSAAARQKRALDASKPAHADLRELLKKKIKNEARDAEPSHRMRGGNREQDDDDDNDIGSDERRLSYHQHQHHHHPMDSEGERHKRRRLSQEIHNGAGSSGGEDENSNEDDEEGAVAEYIRQFKSSGADGIDRRKSPSPPPALGTRSTLPPLPSSGQETSGNGSAPSPPALPSFNSLAIPLRLPPLQPPPHLLGPSSGGPAHSRLPSPLDFSSLRSASPSPAPSPSSLLSPPGYGPRPHVATPPQFFAPVPLPSSSAPPTANPPPGSSQTALLLSHLQEKEQEVEKLTNELKFLHSRLASTTPIPLPSPSPSPSSLFPSPHSYSPSPMHPASPFSHAAYMRSSPAPFMGGHSSSPSPSPSPIHHHTFTSLSSPGASSHGASPLSHHHPHARQFFAPILTLEEQQQQQQHMRDSATPTPPPAAIKRERSGHHAKGRESATRDMMVSPGPVERSSSTSPSYGNRSASPLDGDDFSISPSSPTFSSKVMKKEAIPVVVHWIKKNYELSADTSSDLPKEQVYRHYREFCEETGVQQTNCATFGKILRSVFPNLKTRRLGSRGNTKHHYHGIRRRKSPLSMDASSMGGPTSPPPNLNALAVLASISVTDGSSPMPSPPGIPPSSSGSPPRHAYEEEVDDDDDDDGEDDDMDEDVDGSSSNDNSLQSPRPIRPRPAGDHAGEEWATTSADSAVLSSRQCTVDGCENRAASQRTICEKHKKQQQRARLRHSLDAKITSSSSSSLSSSSTLLPPLSSLSLSSSSSSSSMLSPANDTTTP